MDEETIQSDSQPTGRSLLDRRVPQLLGFYVAASWGAIQFVEWIVERYGLSPYLPDFSLVILFSLLPSVAVVSYYHGSPGRDQWTRIEKVSIPLNIIFTAILMYTLFAGKDLGAATKTLIVQNEDGQSEEHVIAKSEFRKKVLIFNLKNKSNLEELNWMEGGFPFMLHVDLMQDPFFDHNSVLLGDQLSEKVRQAGFPRGAGLPVSLMRLIAEEMHYDYFITGSFDKKSENYSIETVIYDMKSGKQISSNIFSSNDAIALIDDISIKTKKDLGIPDYHSDTIKDLPVKELTSESSKAIEYFVQGAEIRSQKNDYMLSAEKLELAVKEDPSFALAHVFLSMVYANANKSTPSIQAVKRAIKLQYKLPQEFKFVAKDLFYIMTGESNKRVELIKMQVELEPENIDTKKRLAYVYSTSQKYEEAIGVYNDIQAISLRPDIYLDDIGFIHVQMNQLEKAQEFMQAYADEFPNETNSFINLGYVQWLAGNYEAARESYEKTLFIDPSNLNASLRLANLDENAGLYNVAYEKYQKALLQSTEPKERYRIFSSLSTIQTEKGQPQKALESSKLAMAEIKKFQPPLNVTIQQLFQMEYFISAGEKEEALAILKEADQELEPPFDQLTSIGYVIVYTTLKDAESAELYYPTVEETMDSMNSILSGIQDVPIKLKASIDEIKKDYEQAAEGLLKYAQSNSSDIYRYYPLGRVYRKAGKFDDALTYLKMQLEKTPFASKTNHEIGLVYLKLGETNSAIKHFRIAAKIWDEAEADFKMATDNLSLLDELSDNSK
jgi:tetratricopeptide (TPR) repeat protein